VAQLFHIPLEFEFRKVAVLWGQVNAPVLNWARLQDGTVDSLHVMAKIADASGTREVKIPVRHVPVSDAKALLATATSKYPDVGLAEMTVDTTVVAFTHSRKTYIRESDLVKYSVPADDAQMRTDFFRLNNEPAKALNFLNDWGRWLPHRNFVTIGELLEMQRSVREALVESPTAWLSSHYSDLPAARSRSAHVPYFKVLTDSCQIAIRVTSTMDLMREMKFRVCARPDCQIPFSVTSKHSRSYCTQYCAHLESVRRSRGQISQRSR
jgi:hypothetical protein